MQDLLFLGTTLNCTCGCVARNLESLVRLVKVTGKRHDYECNYILTTAHRIRHNLWLYWAETTLLIRLVFRFWLYSRNCFQWTIYLVNSKNSNNSINKKFNFYLTCEHISVYRRMSEQSAAHNADKLSWAPLSRRQECRRTREQNSSLVSCWEGRGKFWLILSFSHLFILYEPSCRTVVHGFMRMKWNYGWAIFFEFI